MSALATTTEYKTYAGISASTWDTVLGVLLDTASAMIRRWCDRDSTTGFESAARTEYYDGTNAPTLQLREWPITTLTSVSELDDAGTATALATTEYRHEARTGLVSRHTSVYGRFVSMDGIPSVPGFGSSPSFCAGFQNWKVVYTGGFSTIPADLKMACYKIVDALFAERRKDLAGLQSESIGDYSYVNKPLGDYELTLRKLVAPFIAHYITGGL